MKGVGKLVHYDIFISYSVKNSDIAFELVKVLEQHGLCCWIAPRNIRNGAEWAQEIEKGIRASERFVLLLSKEACESTQVPKEIGLATRYKKKIFPFRLDEVELAGVFRYYLSHCQMLDATCNLSEKMEELASDLKKEIKNLGLIVRIRKSFYIRKKVYVLIGAIIILLVSLGFFRANFLSKSNYNEKVEIIYFVADEDMTLQNYAIDRQILWNRLTNFFLAENLEVEEEQYVMKVTAPVETIGNCDINELLSDYFVLPGELYLGGEETWYENYLLIGREEIEQVSLQTGNLQDIGVAEIAKEGQYVEIYLSKRMAEQINEFRKELEEQAYLFFDVELANQSNVISEDAVIIMEEYFIEHTLSISQDGRTLYVVLENGDEKKYNLFECILKNKPMSNQFAYRNLAVATWENELTANTYGKYQTNIDEMTEDVYEAVYKCYEDLSEGDWLDCNAEWKKMLDQLQIPYAFGVKNDGSRDVVVRFYLKDINYEYLQLLSGVYKFQCSLSGIEGDKFYTCSDFTYEKTGKSYLVKAQVVENVGDKRENYVNSDEVKFCVSQVPILEGRCDNGVLTFTQCPFEEDGSITEKYIGLISLLQMLTKDDRLFYYVFSPEESGMAIYSIEDLYDADNGFGIRYKKIEHEEAVLKERIEACFEKDAKVGLEKDGSCLVTLDVSLTEHFVDDVIENTIQLLKNCELDAYEKTIIYFKEEENDRARIIYTKDASYSKEHLTGVFVGESMEAYLEEMTEKVAKNEYFCELGFRFFE